MKIVCVKGWHTGYVRRARLARKALSHAIECDKMAFNMRKAGVFSPDPKQLSAVAWDIVEEVYAEISDYKMKKKDPLEVYCDENPSEPECIVYDV